MKHICEKICVAVWMLLCLPQLIHADVIQPVWQTGDQWVVKAVYPSPTKKSGWSEPVFWEYNVEASELALTVGVRDQGNRLKLAVQLVFQASENSGSLQCLSQAEITKTRRSREIVKLLTYQKGVPVRTEQTLIPFDTPVFPLSPPSSADFAITTHVTQGLRATNVLRQEVRQISGPIKDIPDWPVEKDLTEVKLVSGPKDDETVIFVQYWHEDFPWPVFGWNKNMKYWLK